MSDNPLSRAQYVQPIFDETTTLDKAQPSSQWPDGYPGPPTLEEVRILNGAAVMAIFKQFGYR